MDKALKIDVADSGATRWNIAKAQAAGCILASCCVSIGLILLAIA